MEPILDETSLVLCTAKPCERIHKLAQVLIALDQTGAPRVLRSVRDAFDRIIADQKSLRFWCFDKATVDRDSGLLVATRLGKQPFIDGKDGLFARAEGSRVAEATVAEKTVVGLGLAAMNDGVAIQLLTNEHSSGQNAKVEVVFLDENSEEVTESLSVLCLVTKNDVELNKTLIQEKVAQSIKDGDSLLARACEVFPRLVLCEKACEQISALKGSEKVFEQMKRHLRILNDEAGQWEIGTSFNPKGLTFSVESGATLQHGKFGPMRDFPTANGFASERWSLHTKMAGASRLYFRAVRIVDNKPRVLIGYCGEHLSTVRES